MHPVAAELAAAWLSGPWTLDGLRARTRRLGQRAELSRSLEAMTLGFWLDLRDRPHERRQGPLAAAIAAHRAFHRVAAMSVDGRVLDPPEMAAPPADWAIPELPTPDALGRWLGVAADELAWLADRRGRAGHYLRYRSGTRLIEAPRRRLKAAQRRIARDLLAHIPPHDAAHGFRQGRSVLTAVQPHAGRDVLVVADLRAFFPSVPAGRVHATLQRAGYPEAVARALTLLCTTSCGAPSQGGPVLAPSEGDRMRRRHLPQGAPTSPALANLCAFHLDARLDGLARRAGGTYTRYADDLIFSGPRALGRPWFLAAVEHIAAAEDFTLVPTKSRVMGRSQRQHVLGIVLNEAPALPRPELERLEAELYNCVRRGPRPGCQQGVAQLRAHLTGRVAWVRHVQPRRARRLVALLGAIDWSSGARPESPPVGSGPETDP